MTVFVLRRLAQTLLVLLITSVLVFGGLFMIGDPVEILVNPSADQIEKDRATGGGVGRRRARAARFLTSRTSRRTQTCTGRRAPCR